MIIFFIGRRLFWVFPFIISWLFLIFGRFLLCFHKCFIFFLFDLSLLTSSSFEITRRVEISATDIKTHNNDSKEEDTKNDSHCKPEIGRVLIRGNLSFKLGIETLYWIVTGWNIKGKLQLGSQRDVNSGRIGCKYDLLTVWKRELGVFASSGR